MIPLLAAAVAALAAAPAAADVSVYPYPQPVPTGGPYEGWQAYDPTPLQDPPLPGADQPLNLNFQVTLDTSGQAQGAGIELEGSYMGISIEMSLAEAIIGPNATWLRPQFLNLMSMLKERGGPPVLRLGGNTQEKAELVDSLPGGASLGKLAIGPTGYTNTPTLMYTLDILKALRATSDLLGIRWFLGIPMNQTTPPRLEIVEQGESIMGEYLWGWQLGNEPDLYELHNYRTAGYSQQNYIDEFQSILDDLAAHPTIQTKNKIGGPGVCCLWKLDDILTNFNYLDRFSSQLSSMIIEHYPIDNCVKGQNDPQTMMNQYTMHSHPQKFANDYKNAVGLALAANKPVILLETNTASCNGFLGLSDAFAAALWIADLGLQLAATSFSHIMVHLGGQAAYYNPFVSPPHNATKPFMWTVGPPWYAILMVTEALGPSGHARVADLNANEGNTYTPGYVIYENNQPARVVLLNYMSDPTGAHDYTANIQTAASQVRVRYMLAPTVNAKIPNITWAGQSFGSYFESDGLPRGEHTTETVPCSGGVCAIKVPAPGAALVFLTDAAYQPDEDMKTFASSHTTRMHNTAAVELGALQTSNGLDAKVRAAMKKASTSSPQNVKKNDAASRSAGALAAAVCALAGALLLAA
ncbi:glycoside hydrolase family 79 protein [Auricularia subglabra TFB-10046 SS5]|uniref:Glycoside hydrolase family 79 protein n=1 Tax=Auricularia subglabra (strain TFB-10046 / SS5) TaxID=717982 RepID=J0WT75_AURST|nr:glycoside hydrolase family 79 protein [Auricularia subglabra TFB-10046 SS5]